MSLQRKSGIEVSSCVGGCACVCVRWKGERMVIDPNGTQGDSHSQVCTLVKSCDKVLLVLSPGSPRILENLENLENS